MAQLYYTAFTIASGQVPSTQSSFPAVIKPANTTRFKTIGNGGHVNNSSGFDLRPYSDINLTTPLTYELVPGTYDAANGTFEMHVNITAQDGQIVYVGYGDTGLTTDGSGNPFNSNFKRVYHFADGTTLSAVDSTGTQNGTFVNTPTAGVGQIDGGASFASASTQYMTSSNTLNPLSVSIEAWVKGTSFPNAYNAVVSRSDGASNYWSIYVRSDGKLAVYFHDDSGSDISYDGTGSHTLSTGTWYYLAATYEHIGGLIGYVNAASDGTAGGGLSNLNTTAVNLRIASDPATGSREWNGIIDEVRISDLARNQNWITTSYNNQLAPNTFWTIGSEVSLGADVLMGQIIL